MVGESRIDDFIQAFSALTATGDREADLGRLLEAALKLGAGTRAHAILMKKNTVTAEASRSRDGNPFQIEEDVRKAAARHGIAAQDGNAPAVERTDGRVIIPFAFNDKEGAAITLFGLPEDGAADLGVALAWAGTRVLSLTEETRTARERVGQAESALTQGGVGAVAYLKPVSELERDAIELALRSSGWNKEEAARRLGISRASIYMKVKKYGLQHPPKESNGE
ncbi:MAG: helix-turn-helix domain-containing protein [Planctomycetota bacterium JB042]